MMASTGVWKNNRRGKLLVQQVYFLNWMPQAGCGSIAGMRTSYGQFCPIAKASEIFATRWTPLILRELMRGMHTFNEIHRGVPLISRALLVTRLRELENRGIIERSSRRGDRHQYRLTPIGEQLRSVVRELGNWGLANTRDWIKPDELDPSVLLWSFRRRADKDALPERSIVVRFEFSSVPKVRTKYRIMWLVLNRSGIDVCGKDHGFCVDLVFRGDIADFVAVHLGHVRWSEVAGKALKIEGDRRLVRQLPIWLGLDKVVGKDFQLVRPA